MSIWKSAPSWEAFHLATEGMRNEIELDPKTGKVIKNQPKGIQKLKIVNRPKDMKRDSTNVPLNISLNVLQTPPSLMPANVFPMLCASNVNEVDNSQIVPSSIVPANKSPSFVTKWLESSASTLAPSSNFNLKKSTNKYIVLSSNGSVPSENKVLMSREMKEKSINVENIISAVKKSEQSSRERPMKMNARRKLVYDNCSPYNLSSRSIFSNRSCEEVLKQKAKDIGTSSKKSMGHAGWYEAVYIWFRFFVTQPFLNVTKQLYLYGPPAVGKSQAVLDIIGDMNISYCFFASSGQYAFDGLDVKEHKIVIFEQFEIRHWKTDLGNLNQFLCGQYFTINRKWKTNLKVRFPGMVVIISRDGRIVDKGLDARLYQVHASSPYSAEELVSYEHIP